MDTQTVSALHSCGHVKSLLALHVFYSHSVYSQFVNSVPGRRRHFLSLEQFRDFLLTPASSTRTISVLPVPKMLFNSDELLRLRQKFARAEENVTETDRADEHDVRVVDFPQHLLNARLRPP